MAGLMNLLTRIFLSVFIICLLGSCVNNYEYTGLKLNTEDIEKIKKEKMNQEQIANFIGSPTFSSDLGSNTWYYVYSTTNKVAFFRPVIVDEEIVAIGFNGNGGFANLKVYNKDDINKISFSEDSTPTHGTKTNPVQQILKNIQKYSVPNFSKKKPGGM